MIVNITGYAVLYGFNTVIDSLGSRAYGFACSNININNDNNKSKPLINYYHNVGLIVQQTILIGFLLCIPIIIIWLNAYNLLILFNQDPIISYNSQKFINILIPGLFPILIYRAIQSYLNLQGIIRPLIFTSITSFIFQIILNYLFIHVFNFGFIGSAYATLLNQYLICGIIIIIIIYNKYYLLTWPPFIGFSILFTNLKPIFLVGLSGILMLCLEWSIFEVFSIIAGLQSTYSLDTIVLIINLISFYYMIPLGISIGTSILIANELGSNKPKNAKLISISSLIGTIIICIIPQLLLLILGNYVSKLFTNSIEVLNLINQFWPFIVIEIFFDSIQGVQGGILRGIAKQSLGAIIGFISYYCIGLTIGLLLIYKLFNYNRNDYYTCLGLLLGLISGVIISSILYFIKLIKIDWNLESEKAQLNVKRYNK